MIAVFSTAGIEYVRAVAVYTSSTSRYLKECTRCLGSARQLLGTSKKEVALWLSSNVRNSGLHTSAKRLHRDVWGHTRARK